MLFLISRDNNIQNNLKLFLIIINILTTMILQLIFPNLLLKKKKVCHWMDNCIVFSVNAPVMIGRKKNGTAKQLKMLFSYIELFMSVNELLQKWCS